MLEYFLNSQRPSVLSKIKVKIKRKVKEKILCVGVFADQESRQ